MTPSDLSGLIEMADRCGLIRRPDRRRVSASDHARSPPSWLPASDGSRACSSRSPGPVQGRAATDEPHRQSKGGSDGHSDPPQGGERRRCAVATSSWTTNCRSSLTPRVPRSRFRAATMQLETIVLRTGRPVLAIKRRRGTADVRGGRQRRLAVAAHRRRASASSRRPGRWAGSRWRATALPGSAPGGSSSDETIVTNRHVAAEFGRDTGTTFVFRKGLGGDAMRASIDLLEEIDREDSLTFELRRDPAHRGQRTARTSRSSASSRSAATARRPRSPWRSRAARRPRGGHRLPGARQPDPRRRPDGPDLRQRLRQEAPRAGPAHRAARRHPAPRLLDPRRQLGIGPAVPRDRRGGRPALRGQVPPGQLRGPEPRRGASGSTTSGAGAPCVPAGRRRARARAAGVHDAARRAGRRSTQTFLVPLSVTVQIGDPYRAAGAGADWIPSRPTSPWAIPRDRRRGLRRDVSGGLHRPRGLRPGVPRRRARRAPARPSRPTSTTS